MTDQMRNWLTRGAVALVIFVVGVLAGWIAHGHGSDVARISFYKDWRIACPADTDQKGSCEMASDVVDQKSNQRIAQITLARQSDKDDKKVIVVTVPLTVLIPAGLGVQFGTAAAQTYPYATCVPAGCVAMIPADDKLLTSMEGTSPMSFVVVTERGTKVNVPVPMQGYGAAAKNLRDTEAKRHSWWRRLWS